MASNFEVKGPAQPVEESGEGFSYTLHDPFLASTLEFIRRCLDQLSKALSITVAFTYKQLRVSERGNFFLASYSNWREVKQKKAPRSNYADPSNVDAGQDIQWLLKNFRFHLKFYAEKLEINVDELDDMVSFLLDSIRNQLAHQYYLKSFEEDDPGNPWLRKHAITRECIEASIDLVSAICEADFYKAIFDDVSKYLRNLERMLEVLEQHRVHYSQVKAREQSSFDTEGILKWLKSNELEEELEKELSKDATAEARPLTNFFQMVVIPRIMKK